MYTAEAPVMRMLLRTLIARLPLTCAHDMEDITAWRNLSIFLSSLLCVHCQYTTVSCLHHSSGELICQPPVS